MSRRDPLLVELMEVEASLRDLSPATETYKKLLRRKAEIEMRLSTPAEVLPSCGKIATAV
jgi:hypothetical protein